MSYRKTGNQQYRQGISPLRLQSVLKLTWKGNNPKLIPLDGHQFIRESWKSIPNKDLPIGKVGYNSHGEWSTIGDIREAELERGNYFPSSLKRFPDDTPAIWITLTARKALRYSVDADAWDRIDAPDGKLTREETEMMRDIPEVELLPTDIIAFTDGDEGYLVVRPS